MADNIIDQKNFREISLFLRTSQRGVERIPQTVAEQVEAQHQQADEDRGEQDHMGIGEQIVLSLRQKGTDTGHVAGVQIDNAQIGQAGLGEDDTGYWYPPDLMTSSFWTG